jgi:flagellar basal body rod protein FlgF
VSIDPKKCCGAHSKEKEDKGECCQQDEQARAESLTYEQSFVNKVHSMVYMDETKEKHE